MCTMCICVQNLTILLLVLLSDFKTLQINTKILSGGKKLFLMFHLKTAVLKGVVKVT